MVFYFLMSLFNLSEVLVFSFVSAITIFLITIFRFKVPLLVEFFFVFFVFLSTFLGTTLNFYETFFWWDKMLHFFSGFLLVLFGVFVFYKLSPTFYYDQSLFLVLFVCFLFSSSLAGFWELFEYFMDVLFVDLYMQKGLDDTILDMLYAKIASVITCIFLYKYINRIGKKKFLIKLGF